MNKSEYPEALRQLSDQLAGEYPTSPTGTEIFSRFLEQFTKDEIGTLFSNTFTYLRDMVEESHRQGLLNSDLQFDRYMHFDKEIGKLSEIADALAHWMGAHDMSIVLAVRGDAVDSAMAADSGLRKKQILEHTYRHKEFSYCNFYIGYPSQADRFNPKAVDTVLNLSFGLKGLYFYTWKDGSIADFDLRDVYIRQINNTISRPTIS